MQSIREIPAKSNRGTPKKATTWAEVAVTGIPETVIASGKLMAKAWAKSLEPKEHIDCAHSFMELVLKSYWFASNAFSHPPELSRNVKLVRLDESVTAVATAMGRAAAQLETIEASYILGNVYTAVLPASTRSSQGIFYTPPSLTRRLIALSEQAGVNWATAKVVDPACGGGAFLAPVALKMKQALRGKTPRQLIHHIEKNLKGFDLDPFAAWMTQVFVEVVLRQELTAIGRALKPLVTVCNSLQLPKLIESSRYDLVIANPPYGKVSLSDELREQYKDGLYGHANYYGLFTQLALELVKQKGIVSLLTPTSYVSGEYFKSLRKVIREKAQPLAIDFISVRKGVFEDVLQETMMAVYVRKKSKSQVKVHQITTGNGMDLQVKNAGNLPLPTDLTKPWILPRTPEEVPYVQAMKQFKSTLADWGYQVSTGPLVWNRHKEQLSDKPGNGSTHPIVWAEAVTQDGKFVLRYEKKNHKKFITLKEEEDWLLTQDPCILLQRTTAKEQGKRLIAAALPAALLAEHRGVVVENHVNMLIGTSSKPAVTPEVLSAFLNSRAANQAFRSISGSVAVSAYELESFPLPDTRKLKVLTRLVNLGADQEKIEAACEILYSRNNG